jgi:hypothetical protein
MKMNDLIIILLILCNFCCDKLVDHGYFIKVQNNSNDTVWCYSSYNYPDTSIAENKPLLQMISPNVYTKLESKEKWEEVLPKDTISIFILSKDTIDKYSWDIIKSDYNILKRYDLSIKDLEKNSWTVTYP